MCKEVKKGIVESIDKLLFKAGIKEDVKIFGQPLEDFDIEDLSHYEMSSIRKVLLKKIDNLAV